jgi:hypothetical protein
MGECLAGFLASRSPNVTEQSGRLNRVKTVFVFGIEQSAGITRARRGHQLFFHTYNKLASVVVATLCPDNRAAR